MLLLILAYRHQIRLIQQDIRRHKRRIGKQSAVDIVGIFRAFILELRHAAQLAEHGVAVENPAQLRVLVHMALEKQHIFLRIKTAGDILGKLLQGAAAQVGRILADGDRVQIRHKVKAVKFVRSVLPVADRAQIGTERQVAGGLNAGEHSLFGLLRYVFSHHSNASFAELLHFFSQVYIF